MTYKVLITTTYRKYYTTGSVGGVHTVVIDFDTSEQANNVIKNINNASTDIDVSHSAVRLT